MQYNIGNQMAKSIIKILALLALAFTGCLLPSQDEGQSTRTETEIPHTIHQEAKKDSIPALKFPNQTAHIFVALCDNKYQGIVPVPRSIGNGQDAGNNLYWGAGYGLKTFFTKSKDWKLIKSSKPDSIILERLIFKHHQKDFFLVADAYNGKYIKKTTVDYLNSLAGKIQDTLIIDTVAIGIEGNADLLAYIGHDGLMDFRLEENFVNKTRVNRDAIILACQSKDYFEKYIISTKANPIIWTTGLMAPEAYTLHAALEGYVNGEDDKQIARRAAESYAHYQKCGIKAAANLLVTGGLKE